LRARAARLPQTLLRPTDVATRPADLRHERRRHGYGVSPPSFDIAIPLADAIAAAHAQAIVHRDLKPGNVMVTVEGRVKVLDFGLAKAEPGTAPGPSDPTRGTETERDVVIGTHGYMSPEQARGQTVDARSDIFGLGVMLHEMLTGRRPFSGDTPTDVLSSIIKDVPPLVSSIRAGLPREI
jgi:eukaryotic-like serine/threonine-protein kinase